MARSRTRPAEPRGAIGCRGVQLERRDFRFLRQRLIGDLLLHGDSIDRSLLNECE